AVLEDPGPGADEPLEHRDGGVRQPRAGPPVGTERTAGAQAVLPAEGPELAERHQGREQLRRAARHALQPERPPNPPKAVAQPPGPARPPTNRSHARTVTDRLDDCSSTGAVYSVGGVLVRSRWQRTVASGWSPGWREGSAVRPSGSRRGSGLVPGCRTSPGGPTR